MRNDRNALQANDAGRDFEQTWRARFEEFAESRDDDAGIAGWSPTGLDARLRRFRSLWHPRAGPSRWLDAGCGAGTYVRFLHAQGADVVGVDYSLVSAIKARTRSANAAIAVADVRQLPFLPSSFDGVLCFGVMQALRESEPALRELSIALRPGGELWVDALNRFCIVNAAGLAWRAVRGKGMHLRYESPASLCRLVRERGFDDVSVHWLPLAPAGWPRMQRLFERRWFRRMLDAAPMLGHALSHSFIVRARKPPA